MSTSKKLFCQLANFSLPNYCKQKEGNTDGDSNLEYLVGVTGWGVEVGESIQEGLIRECFEETGYTIKASSNILLHVGE